MSKLIFRDWLKSHLNEFDGFVFDIDGVLILKNDPITGANELLHFFRNKNIPFSILTNDGNHSVSEKTQIIKLFSV